MQRAKLCINQALHEFSRAKYCVGFELCNPFLHRFYFIYVNNHFVGQRYTNVFIHKSMYLRKKVPKLSLIPQVKLSET